jgi:hypothetical protein
MKRARLRALLALSAAEFDLLDLDTLSLTTNDSLFAAIALAQWLLEVLRLFGCGNNTSLLHFTREAPQQIFCRFLRIFTGYLYHACNSTLTEMILQTEF